MLEIERRGGVLLTCINFVEHRGGFRNFARRWVGGGEGKEGGRGRG